LLILNGEPEKEKVGESGSSIAVAIAELSEILL